MTILKLVQLHSEAKGAVEELVEAIEELVSDLNNALEELEFDFQQRTATHNSDVIGLGQEIQDAEIDIDRTEDTVANLLNPRRSQLNNRLAAVQENQEENRKNLAEAGLVREQEHEAYEFQVAELNGATESVDEALALLQSLGNPSLMQVKKFQTSLKKIESKITKRGKLSPMIRALVSLASNQNFADQDSLRQIVDALNDFRTEVVDSLNDLTLSEQEAQEDYEEYVDQLEAEYAEFQRQINSLNQDLDAVNAKIDELTNFARERATDLNTYQQQLELENETFAEETEIYTDLKNEYLRELAVSEQGLSLVEGADFSNIHVFWWISLETIITNFR